jgi:ketosteroid isomerase-like protein
MSQENVELVRRAYEGLNRRLDATLAVIDEVVAPEIEWRAVGRLPDTRGGVRGPEALKGYFEQLFATFDFHSEAEEFIDAGDAVVVVTRQTARGKASGAEVTDPLVTVWGVRQGKVTYFDAYRTKAEALEAAGVRE